MSNDEIPKKLWELRNEVMMQIEWNAIGNDMHMNYKSSWRHLGHELKRIGEEIEELAKQFVQPEEDE